MVGPIVVVLTIILLVAAVIVSYFYRKKLNETGYDYQTKHKKWVVIFSYVVFGISIILYIVSLVSFLIPGAESSWEIYALACMFGMLSTLMVCAIFLEFIAVKDDDLYYVIFIVKKYKIEDISFGTCERGLILFNKNKKKICVVEWTVSNAEELVQFIQKKKSQKELTLEEKEKIKIQIEEDRKTGETYRLENEKRKKEINRKFILSLVFEIALSTIVLVYYEFALGLFLLILSCFSAFIIRSNDLKKLEENLLKDDVTLGYEINSKKRYDANQNKMAAIVLPICGLILGSLFLVVGSSTRRGQIDIFSLTRIEGTLTGLEYEEGSEMTIRIDDKLDNYKLYNYAVSYLDPDEISSLKRGDSVTMYVDIETPFKEHYIKEEDFTYYSYYVYLLEINDKELIDEETFLLAEEKEKRANQIGIIIGGTLCGVSIIGSVIYFAFFSNKKESEK